MNQSIGPHGATCADSARIFASLKEDDALGLQRATIVDHRKITTVSARNVKVQRLDDMTVSACYTGAADAGYGTKVSHVRRTPILIQGQTRYGQQVGLDIFSNVTLCKMSQWAQISFILHTTKMK